MLVIVATNDIHISKYLTHVYYVSETDGNSASLTESVAVLVWNRVDRKYHYTHYAYTHTIKKIYFCNAAQIF